MKKAEHWVSVEIDMPLPGDYKVKVIRGGKPIELVKRLVCKNGNHAWFGGCRPFCENDVVTHWLKNSSKPTDNRIMKVDLYQSTIKPSFSIAVPAGTSLDSFTGDVKLAVEKSQPWKNLKTNVDLNHIAVGSLFEHLEKQILELGAGAMKTQVNFNEI